MADQEERKPDASANDVPKAIDAASRLSGDAPRPPPERPRPHQPYRPTKKVPAKPRRVRGGIKLASKEGEPIGDWIGQRFLRVIEDGVPGAVVREGLEYGRLGQTRRLEFEGGEIHASVQGRRQRSYSTSLALEAFSPEDRERVVDALAEQSRYAAKLLAGELPPNIEDLFAPLGLKLFPGGAKEIAIKCDCGAEEPFCKHGVCVAALLAERMSTDAFLIFALRGLPGDLLIDALRQKRAIAGLGSESAPVHLSHVPGVSEVACDPLEQELGRFWTDPSREDPEAGAIDLGVQAPQVSHALLRRLGPSPFTESRFRLVGLLATCYDLVSEHVLKLHATPGSDVIAGELEGDVGIGDEDDDADDA
ncbi:MAG: hypothetical protein CMJ31_08625 [Phycisphaerae bacterium]|nr:hypothetical protein [Phycisphaerae bacterium]